MIRASARISPWFSSGGISAGRSNLSMSAAVNSVWNVVGNKPSAGSTSTGAAGFSSLNHFAACGPTGSLTFMAIRDASASVRWNSVLGRPLGCGSRNGQ